MTCWAKQVLATAVVSLSTFVLPALAQDTATLERRGEALLSRHCAMCHALGPAGGSPNPRAPPFPTISRQYPVESLREALAKSLLTGHPDMPRFTFEPREIEEILAYLGAIRER